MNKLKEKYHKYLIIPGFNPLFLIFFKFVKYIWESIQYKHSKHSSSVEKANR